MGWAFCGTDDDGREIGYGVTAVCDHPGCTAEIDRGLAYACGGMHGGGDQGCGRYYCSAHLFFAGEPTTSLCERCVDCRAGGHRWKGHTNPSTPDGPAESVAYCDWCGAEKTD